MSLRQSAVNFLRRFCVSRTCNFSFSNQPKHNLLISVAGRRTSGHHEFERHRSWNKQYGNVFGWIFLSAQAAIVSFEPALAEDVSTDRTPENVSSAGFRKVEDGSIISNEHTSKWRIFTDHGRDLFLQRKLDEAEFFFLAALKEAKEGFGERDAHVASACNNVAELYRVTKEFDKAEPLYLEAIRILEESYGPDDVRVGAALHNLGQFYIVQQRLEHARVSYERALKIKRRVLGEGHPDYAETMYHLANVLYLQGNEHDSEALVLDSIRVLEEGGLGASATCIKRMQFLAQIYAKSKRFAEAENVQRRILHLMELSKGWDSLDTVVAADRLSVTLQSAGSLKEAEDLMERCLAARKTLLPENHIQIAANIVNIASVKKLKFDQLRKINITQAMTELEKAKALYNNSIRLCHELQVQFKKQKGMQNFKAVSARVRKDTDWAMIILLQSYHNLAWVETAEIQDSGKQDFQLVVENTLRRCISAYMEYETLVQSSASPEVKAQYILCLKNLSDFLCEKASMGEPAKLNLDEIKREIKRVES